MPRSHVSEQVSRNLIQIEPARHLASNFGGNILRAIQRWIDQIPQT
jgi:hypothetical protein